MPDEVVTMVTIDNAYRQTTIHTTFLTPEQQEWFLFVLMGLFIAGLILYLYFRKE